MTGSLCCPAVHDIINVDLPRPRERSGEEFIRIRTKIHEYFFQNAIGGSELAE